jgi:hypothetical protein
MTSTLAPASVALTDFWHFCILGITWYYMPGLLRVERGPIDV